MKENKNIITSEQTKSAVTANKAAIVAELVSPSDGGEVSSVLYIADDVHEWRSCNWMDFECTRDGRFRRRGRECKVRQNKRCPPFICVNVEHRQLKERVNRMLCRAWHPDYYEGCCIIPVDGDLYNVQLSNLRIVTKEEHRQWCYDRKSEGIRKARLASSPSDDSEEWLPTGEYDLEVSREGHVRRFGHQLRVYPYKSKGSVRVFVPNDADRKRLKSFSVPHLMVKAFMPEQYYDNCYIVRKDGNQLNVAVDNLEVVTKDEFIRQKSERRYGKTNELMEQEHGKFMPTGLLGIEVTKNGRWYRRCGRCYKTSFSTKPDGRRCTPCMNVLIEGKRHYFTASHMVARAWRSWEWEDGCQVNHNDGDIWNIDADNLTVISEQMYYDLWHKRTVKQRTFYRGEERQKLLNVITEANLSLGYMESCSFSDINKYVERHLMPELIEWCIVTMNISKSRCVVVVGDAIARMYELLDTGRAVWGFSFYCKRLIRNLVTTGDYGRTGRLPKHIHDEVQSLDIQSLCDKFNVRPKTKK